MSWCSILVCLLMSLPWTHFQRGGLSELTREWTWIPLGQAGLVVPVLDLTAEKLVSLGAFSQGEPVIEWSLDGISWNPAPLELRGGLWDQGRHHLVWTVILPRVIDPAGESRLVGLRVRGNPQAFPALVRY